MRRFWSFVARTELRCLFAGGDGGAGGARFRDMLHGEKGEGFGCGYLSSCIRAFKLYAVGCVKHCDSDERTFQKCTLCVMTRRRTSEFMPSGFGHSGTTENVPSPHSFQRANERFKGFTNLVHLCKEHSSSLFAEDSSCHLLYVHVSLLANLLLIVWHSIEPKKIVIPFS